MLTCAGKSVIIVLMKATEMFERGIILEKKNSHRQASSNPLFYYANSLKSPRSIYRWLAVWKN
jgi:hypothetical protein